MKFLDYLLCVLVVIVFMPILFLAWITGFGDD